MYYIMKELLKQENTDKKTEWRYITAYGESGRHRYRVSVSGKYLKESYTDGELKIIAKFVNDLLY